MKRDPRRWRTPFASWVREFTVARIQRDLSVSEQAVFSWVSGRTLPSLPRAVALARLSEGRITPEDILRHHDEVAHGAGTEHGSPHRRGESSVAQGT